MVRPDICVFTNIGESHIEYLGSKEGILRAKCEMLEYMRPGGRIIINGDDPYLLRIKDQFTGVTACGAGPANDVRAENIEDLGLDGSRFTVGKSRVYVPAPGPHMVLNALIAYAAGRALGVSEKAVLEGIASFKPSGVL